MFFILVSSVLAEQVIIFNFNYDHGIITLKDQVIKEGYYPDRNIQPEEGYTCKLVGENNRNFYSFKFDIPTNLFTDAKQGSMIFGGVVFLNETDFSFVMPYIPKSSDIVCYNRRGYEILRQSVIHPIMSPEKSNFTWAYVAVMVAFFAIFIYKLRKNKK